MKVSSIAIVFGFLLALALPMSGIAGPQYPTGLDTDSDGVENAFDNCSLTANPDQGDSIHNGCGNACRVNACDGTGDSVVGIPDFSLLVAQLGTDCSAALPERLPACSMDCTNDGIVGIPDFSQLVGQIGQPASSFPPGPSGITNRQCQPTGTVQDPTAICDCTPAP